MVVCYTKISSNLKKMNFFFKLIFFFFECLNYGEHMKFVIPKFFLQITTFIDQIESDRPNLQPIGEL